MAFLVDFTGIKQNNRLYGGNAGLKKGIIYNNKNWLLKFPQETSSFNNVNISFTTSPLSEYVGSHIYSMLGYKTHNTILGWFYNQTIDKKQLVVACEDFTDNNRYTLLDYECIKNNYSNELQNKLIELSMSMPNEGNSTLSQHSIKIEEILLQFKENELIKNNRELIDCFWDMLVIDCIINNNDRNKNNWGLLYNNDNGTYTLAPIYDNGASFVSKHSDEKLKGIMETYEKMKNSVLNGMCYYSIGNKLYNFRNFFKKLEANNWDDMLKISKERVIKKFKSKWEDIKAFINSIPNEENGVVVITDIQKKFFIDSMYIRLKEIFNF